MYISGNGTSDSGSERSVIRDFYTGLFLALSSCIFIGSSFVLKKKALLRLSAIDNARRAGSGGFGYLKDWLWWCGVITMGFGEACNFAAYAFAPATLITPLGALSVLVTAVLSSQLLNEKLNLFGQIGCAVCILGSVVLVIHSPKESDVRDVAELGDRMNEISFIVYVIFVVLSSIIVVVYVTPRHGQSNILVYIYVCSVIGSLSVLGCKGLGLAIKETLSGANQFGNWLTWFWLFSVVLCVTTQLNYLNKSLDIFNTSMVTPVYYVMFTSFVILASGILFNEWVKLKSEDILGNVVGFLIIVIGIFQMQLFRDYNVTGSMLRRLISRRGIAEVNNSDIREPLLIDSESTTATARLNGLEDDSNAPQIYPNHFRPVRS